MVDSLHRKGCDTIADILTNLLRADADQLVISGHRGVIPNHSQVKIQATRGTIKEWVKILRMEEERDYVDK